MQNQQLWYTRRGKEIRGPFPAPQITRFILLGRIIDTDELSIDQIAWQKVTDIPVLIPGELKANLSDPQAHERLLIARMREDERSARDRRDEADKDAPAVERRCESSSERRRYEEEKMVRHREIKTAIAEASRHRKQNYFMRGVLATLVLGGIITAAWIYQPWQKDADIVNCNAPPAPWVNWNNCLMEGTRLIATDLRGARLRNANVASGDLSGSQLGGADLSYTNLVGASLLNAQMAQAVLVGANLRNARLINADLQGANMAYAILQGADLSSADLSNADLSDADLRGANLIATKLSGAKLDNAIWLDGTPCQLGSVGECRQ